MPNEFKETPPEILEAYHKHAPKVARDLKALSDGPSPMPDIPTRGVYEKFKVIRTDGSGSKGGKHEGCQYFVLDLTHDPFCRSALLAYAKACRKKYPKLAADIHESLRSKGPRTCGCREAFCGHFNFLTNPPLNIVAGRKP